MDDKKVYYADGEPCDIPEGCRLDVRVQMPEDSVWNLRETATDGEVSEAAE
ncbi:phage tail fiber protein [Xenorhabdus szentirmaii]